MNGLCGSEKIRRPVRSFVFLFLQVVFLGEEGVDAGGVRKVKHSQSSCPTTHIIVIVIIINSPHQIHVAHLWRPKKFGD